MPTNSRPHISVCVCTYKRAALLPDLIRAIEAQRTDGEFTHEVVVADNDAARSAEAIVRHLAQTASIPISYCVEPQTNIALARNAALARAIGDFVAFIDDDEVPVSDWLEQLFRTQAAHSADAVLGPVLSRFEQEPPVWVRKGGFFERPRHPTGYRIKWPEARTGNVLLVRKSIERLSPPFRSQFGSGGEDVDFFRRLAEQGGVLVWSNEAVAHELVPAYRCTRRFLAGRALLRGSNFPKQSGERARHVIKSIIAVPCYILALPVLALIGHHMFIAYAMKLLEHASRLLSMAGVPLVTERQT
jgi:succinoglycan biosynthesis protein ExoM